MTITQAPEEYDRSKIEQILTDIDGKLEKIGGRAEKARWKDPTNYTEKRDIDASTATLADVANMLATLVNALKTKGVI